MNWKREIRPYPVVNQRDFDIFFLLWVWRGFSAIGARPEEAGGQTRPSTHQSKEGAQKGKSDAVGSSSQFSQSEASWSTQLAPKSPKRHTWRKVSLHSTMINLSIHPSICYSSFIHPFFTTPLSLRRQFN